MSGRLLSPKWIESEKFVNGSACGPKNSSVMGGGTKLNLVKTQSS